MNPSLQSPLTLAGRILIAIIFLGSGISKLTGFAGTVAYISSKGLPLPEVGAAAACALELIAGLALMLGWKTRLMALLLAKFTIVSAFLFHGFWSFPPEQLAAQQVQFLKNLCIAGGLMFVVAFGAGAWSLDERASKDQ